MAFSDEVFAELSPEKLADISPKIHDGDILLCAANDPFSRLIGWSTQSPWSHVAFAHRWPALGRIVVFECVQRIGVHIVPIERFISQTSDGTRPFPGKIVLARHADTPGVRALRPLLDYAVDCMGDPFSPAEIAKIAARISFGRLNRTMPRSLAPKNKFICSEYVAKCFSKINIKIQWDGLGFIAPADFAEDPKIRAVAQFKTR